MNDNIHEPKFVQDSRNAVMYFLVLTFVTLGAAFLMCGLIAPVFGSFFKRLAEKWARNKTVGSYDDNLKYYSKISFFLMMMWWIGSWALFILGHFGYGGMLSGGS